MADDTMVAVQVTNVKWGALVLIGLLAVVFGLLIVLFPGISATVLIELIGIFIIVLSFGVLMIAAVSPGGWKNAALPAILGIIGFFFGIATILSPVVMGQVIFTLVGIALFVAGLLCLILATTEKHMTHRGIFALQGIISIVCGLLIIILPLFGAVLALVIIGAYFVFWGILSIILGYSIRCA
ncbi:MAG: DUF308 domain-containing protein [Methanoregula sp.]|nr:DUF308 domain-containing protein [Methanoregula sp.]